MSRLSGTEAVFASVKTCHHLNYFSTAEIKLKKWGWMTYSFQFYFSCDTIWLSFNRTDLDQILLCHIHSLSLRMKVTVNSRYKPAHMGATRRSFFCVVLQGQSLGLDCKWLYYLCPRLFSLWLSQWLSLSVWQGHCLSSEFKTQLISHLFLQGQGLRSPQWRCLSWLSWRRELSLLRWKRWCFFILLKVNSILSEISIITWESKQDVMLDFTEHSNWARSKTHRI